MQRTFQIYRYDPDKDAKPYMQTVKIELDGHERDRKSTRLNSSHT